MVVAILGVMAALAAPSLLGAIHRARLNSAGDQIATFIARAQNEAMVSKRCVRVTVRNNRQLVAERLNTFDCDNDPDSATKIDPGKGVWIQVVSDTIESVTLKVFLDGTNGSQVPHESSATIPAPGAAATGFTDEIRFRPNGRVFSNDVDGSGNPKVDNDDAVVSIVDSGLNLPGNGNIKKVLVNAHGLICAIPRGEEPAGTAPNFDCP